MRVEAPYTRKRGLVAVVAVVASLLAFSLVGCAGTRGASNAESGADAPVNTNEPIPASQAFGTKSVWLQYMGEQPAKDGAIQRVLSFDGNGNVTVYEVEKTGITDTAYESLTFGDLNGLSNDEIVEIAKEKSRERFEATKQGVIDETNETIEGIIEGGGDSGRVANAQAGQQVNEAAEYREPEAVQFTLKIETDDTGNSAKLETLSFEYEALNGSHFYSGSIIGDSPDRYADEELYELSPVDIDLYSPNSTCSIVYDTTFGGFAKLATIVDETEGLAGFTWDTVDTEGIEVD